MFFLKALKGLRYFEMIENMKEWEVLLKFYTKGNPPLKFSAFLKLKNKSYFQQKKTSDNNSLVKIIAYCFMPTHFHLVLKQLKHNGISIFMRRILNSYAKYFNIKTKRKGPLWESRFKNVILRTDEILLHVTRYVHLNPVTAYLVDYPNNWAFSSYKEFFGSDWRRWKGLWFFLNWWMLNQKVNRELLIQYRLSA